MLPRQKVVLFLGAIMVVLNFMFPQTQYPSIEEKQEDGRLVAVAQSTRTASAMPIWKARALQQGNTGKPFSDTVIMWPNTIVRGIAIVAVFGWVCYSLRTPPKDKQDRRTE